MRRLDTAAQAIGGDQALAGRLTWRDAVHGWVAESRVDARGTAQMLSGNGQPK